MSSNITVEKIAYYNQPDCLLISNNNIELIVTTNIGPRIICCRYKNGENLFAELPMEDGLKTDFGDWHSFGGHRFWHAPEVNPRSYVPDNSPVAYEISSESIKILPSTESQTGIRKEILIELDPCKAKATITHTLFNNNVWSVKLAPWALTIMKEGGQTIIPNEPFISHDDYLLPARPVVLWHFSDMSDSRWKFGSKFIRLNTDKNLEAPQKIGVCDKQGWAGYLRNNILFIKKFPYIDGAEYPDYGCNCETYTAADFMELESLGSLDIVEPGGHVSHVEEWYLFNNISNSDNDDELEKTIQPCIESID